MNDTLLPRPFCSGEAEEDATGCVEYYGHEHHDYSITCKGCGARVEVTTGSGRDGVTHKGDDFPCSCCHDTREAAIDKWSTRALLQAPAQPEQAQGWQMVLPERRSLDMKKGDIIYRAALVWNACLDEVARLNAAAPRTPAQVYQCPRCATSLEVDPTAKPYKPPVQEPVAVVDKHIPSAEIQWTEYGAELALPHGTELYAAAKPSDDVMQDAWIPVSERLPKPNTQVLVVSKKHGVFFAIHKNRSLHPWEYLDGDTCREKITHWMPLPAAPIAGGGE